MWDLGGQVRFLLAAEGKKVRAVSKVSSSEFEGLLVGEWIHVPQSRLAVFPTSSRRKVGLSCQSDHCWMRKGFFLVFVHLFFRHAQISFPVKGFWELLYFWMYLFYFFSNPYKYQRESYGEEKTCCHSTSMYNTSYSWCENSYEVSCSNNDYKLDYTSIENYDMVITLS